MRGFHALLPMGIPAAQSQSGADAPRPTCLPRTRLRKGPGHDIRRSNAAFVLEDSINNFLGIVGKPKQVQVTRADVPTALQSFFHPTDQAFPMIFAKQDQRKAWDTLGLDQSQNLEELVEGAEAARHEDKADAV